MQKKDLKLVPFENEYNTKIVLQKYTVQHQQILSRVFNWEERSEPGRVSHDQQDTLFPRKKMSRKFSKKFHTYVINWQKVWKLL